MVPCRSFPRSLAVLCSRGHVRGPSRLLFLSLVLALCLGFEGCAGGGSSANTPMPTVSISLSATTIHAAEGATLTWSSTAATTCTASGAWSGSEQVSGTLSVTQSVPANYTYNLACTGTGGGASESATLTVNPHVLADASAVGAVINQDQFGANMCGGCDINVPPSLGASLKGVGVNLLRWPLE
jgi:hypothetical protein